MSHALVLDSRDLALELYELLLQADPARWRDDLEVAIRQRLRVIEERLSRLMRLSWPHELGSTVRERLAELSDLLRDGVPSTRLPARALRAEWQAYRRRLQASYHALARSLGRFDIHVPSLRPTNYARNLFHITAAVVALFLVEFVLSPPQTILLAGAFALYAWSMEIGRRLSERLNQRLMAFYGPMAHAHEWHRVNSSSWFVTALLFLSFTGSPLLCAVALVILGLADPAAGMIGRRWGRVRLIHGRSLEGSASFVAVGTAATLAVLALWHPEAKWPASLFIALGAALGGALAELFSRRVDDNLTIPLSAAVAAWLVAGALGVPF